MKAWTYWLDKYLSTTQLRLYTLKLVIGSLLIYEQGRKEAAAYVDERSGKWSQKSSWEWCSSIKLASVHLSEISQLEFHGYCRRMK
jgi:hypothetical protein